jgi:hypothetical protein
MNGLVELREYELVPSRAKEFMDLTTEYAGLRKELMPVQGCVDCDCCFCLDRDA